ncbi:MAG: GNAT family N-acetyltransferase [Clostridium sp.]|nr:GNAT family N-acetyltransferase [Clostridium sp.]
MLRIRPYKPADAESLISWLKEERMVAYWKADRFAWPVTMEQLELYLRDFEEDRNAAAFTALDKQGKIVGHFSFRHIDWEENRAHMGFIIVDPESRGRGYGRQMVHQALRYAIDILGLSAVTLGVYDCNDPARRCYESEGFQKINRPGYEPYRTMFHGEEWEYYYMEAKAENGNVS